MIMPDPVTYPALLDIPMEGPTLELRAFTYNEQPRTVTALLDAIALCGCWVQEQRMVSPTHAELCFEVHLRSAFELYSQLLGAGVELTRESHAKMTGLCTLRGYNPRQAKRRRLLQIRLDVRFLEDNSEFGMMAIGLA